MEGIFINIITITKENLETEHICCAISSHKDSQVLCKKSWLNDRIDEGLVFKKGDVRGKCFIEYLPAEMAWVPVEAPGYMFINCFWISGKYKGQGFSNLLLEECIQDSKDKGKMGLVILSSKKKMPFLSDSKYLKYKGFISVDTADPYFKLFYLPFDESALQPHFKISTPSLEEKGFVLFYSYQCPFTVKYVPIIEEIARKREVPFQVIQLKTREEAQNCPSPFTSYSLFYDGKFVTNEILSDKKFEKLLLKYGY